MARDLDREAESACLEMPGVCNMCVMMTPLTYGQGPR